MNLQNKLKNSLNSKGTAVIDKTGKHSYRELKDCCLGIIDFINKGNIHKVSLCLEQSFEAYAWIISCYMTHIEYSPIDPNAPAIWKKKCADMFSPDIVVCSDGFRDFSFRRFVRPDLSDACSKTKIEYSTPHNKIQTTNFYTLFTSGTTGIPKAVVVSRHALENFIKFGAEEYGVNNCDVCSQFSKLTFDLSIFDIFISLSNGACLVSFFSKISKLFPAEMVDKYKITFWHSVPNVIDYFVKSQNAKGKLSSVRLFNFAGETLYVSKVKELFSVNNNCVIYNVFGHTETTFCMYQKVTINDYLDYSNNISISIGNTIPGYSYVVKNWDKESNSGELVIVGDEIAEGYLNGDEKHVFNTLYSNGKTIRYFLSGDYVSFYNGKLFYNGRLDEQYKVHGFRCNTDEIDNILFTFGISSKTIFFKNNLYTYVLSLSFNEKEVYEIIERNLPEYYRPMRVISIEAFPLNSSGKVDKNMLEALLINTGDD